MVVRVRIVTVGRCCRTIRRFARFPARIFPSLAMLFGCYSSPRYLSFPGGLYGSSGQHALGTDMDGGECHVKRYVIHGNWVREADFLFQQNQNQKASAKNHAASDTACGAQFADPPRTDWQLPRICHVPFRGPEVTLAPAAREQDLTIDVDGFGVYVVGVPIHGDQIAVSDVPGVHQAPRPHGGDVV
jgi:hypothetical protein